MTSLRQKITLGYTAFAVLLIALSVRSLIELHQIEQQIKAGARIAEFFDVALEIRRFEKNLFLYHQAQDVHENAVYVNRARQILEENHATFIELAPEVSIVALRKQIDRYAAQMRVYLAHPGEAAATAIRALGLDIVNTAQTLANSERGALRVRLEQHRRALLFTLAGLLVLLTAAAMLVSRSMVRPLKEMEDSMEAIASGSTDRLAFTANDREITSLVRASNHMLDELRLRQQQQLIQTERLASLGRLISGVAHEINNPLSNISSSAQILLEEGATPDPHWQHDILSQIDSETTRAQRIVRSLLDYASKRDYQQSVIPLRATVEESLRLFRHVMPPQLSIKLDIPEALQIIGDKPRLQQVLINLLKNAVDALQDTGEISISAASSPDDVEIVFSDNGPGIAAEVLPHIFEPFYSTKKASQGSGMGLFIVREIIDEHHGDIRVESTPDKGTQFYIRLPGCPS